MIQTSNQGGCVVSTEVAGVVVGSGASPTVHAVAERKGEGENMDYDEIEGSESINTYHMASRVCRTLSLP